MEKVEMHVPNKGYEGYYGGVKFTNGVGVFTDVKKAKELANRYDYVIVEINEDKEVKAEVEAEVKAAPKAEAKPKRTRKAKAGE